MKRLLFFIGSILLFTSVHGQQVLNLITGEVRDGDEAADPVRTVEILDDGYLVTWDFTEACLIKDKDFSGCILWRYSNYFMDSQTSGEPSILYESEWLKLDKYEIPSMEILDSAYVDFHYQLAPAIPPLPDCDGYEIPRRPITPYEGFFPGSAIEFVRLSHFMNQIHAIYITYPILYNYELKIVRAYTKIVYKVTLSDATTGIEELKTKGELATNGFTLDGRPVKGNAKSVIVQDDKKVIIK